MAAGIAWHTGAFRGLPRRPGIDPGTAYWLILPLHTCAYWRKASLIATGAWQLAGIFVWGHFFLAPTEIDLPGGLEVPGPVIALQRSMPLAVCCTIAYIVIGLAPIGYGAYLQRIRGRITEPRIRATMGNRFFLGQPLNLHIVDYRDHGYEPEYAKIGLRCRREGSTEDVFCQWIDLTSDWISVGSLIAAPSFDIPPDRPASSSSCMWQIEMITKHKDGPRWRIVHPIRVEVAESGEMPGAHDS